MTRVSVLDHGYLEPIESWGSDERIVEAARMSTGKGFLRWDEGPCPNCGTVEEAGLGCISCEGKGSVSGDIHLLRRLWTLKHATPFEMAGLVIEVQAPIFVFREWHRHRTQCLAGSTLLHFESPKSDRLGRRSVYKMPIAAVWRKWQATTRAARPERQVNPFGSRSRIEGMRLRCANEETREILLTRVVDVVKSDPKPLLEVETICGKTIRASKDHRFFTNLGWLRLEDVIQRGALVAVERTAREMALSWDVPPVDEERESWRDVPGWEGVYEVSDFGRVRRCGQQKKRGTVSEQGYVVVNLNRPGVQQTRTVHTLVLEAFKGPRPDGTEARHLNSNRIDCRASNLEWGTAAENANDRLVRGSQQRLTVGFEEIRSVRELEPQVTYDIAVAGPWHNFVADRFVVHNSYNEMSARYVPLPDVNYVPSIERLLVNSKTNKQAGTVTGAAELTEGTAECFRSDLIRSYDAAETLYQQALAAGVPKELARIHLPVGRYSRMRASANLRNWLGFLTLRMDPAAQWEIRQYANAVGDVIAEKFPRTWALFSEGKK
jgi:thymidylate synthase (FAD)